MSNAFRLIISTAAALVMAAPAGAQAYSDGYSFIKAVKERDSSKVNEMVGGERGPLIVNSKDAGNGDTALHIVTRRHDYDYLAFLLGKGAQPNVANKEGETPLIIAARIGWTEGAELLLARRANVDMTNSRGETPLIVAAQGHDVPMVQLLLAHGADSRKTDNSAGYSALDYAKRDPRGAPIVKLLEVKRAAPRAVAGPKL